jgi:hypothetical protein
MVRIDKYGYGMDLYIAEITRDQMTQMEKACSFFGNFYWRKSLQNLWYLKQDKLKALFGVDSFREMKSGNHRYLGPVLTRKNLLDAFVADIKIYENDRLIDMDHAKIRALFQPTPPLPTLTDKNVVVFHGEYYQGVTSFEFQLSGRFTFKHLRLNLIDCGENGFILQSISYKGKKHFGSEEADTRGFLKPQFIVK